MKLFSKMINDRAKKGFTLVEMLLVIAILVIVMAVTVPNAASYVKRIKLMELDDSARSIFMAVQNKMTVMKQSGVKLEDLAGRSTYDPDKLPAIFISPTVPEGTPEDTEFIPPEPRYLRNTIEDGHGTENPLVSLTTIEGQLYNHNYVIEYDATTGRVFGVFYSEESNLLQYPNEYMTLDERTFEERLRADELVGYYGGEGQLMKVPTGGEEPPLDNIADSTLEKLVFVLEPPKNADGSYKAGKYYFEVKITGQDANKQSHTITIVPYTPGDNSKNFYVEGDKGVVILDSIAPGCGGDNGQWYLPGSDKHSAQGYSFNGYTLERDFRGWVYINSLCRKEFFSNNCKDIEHLDKDSYDPYTHGVTSWNFGRNYVIGSHSNSWEYAQYYRIDPGSDIVVSIKRTKEDGTTLEPLPSSNTYNSYFDSIDGDKAVIKAGRHLQNLANQPSVDKIKGAYLARDIDFSQDTGNYISWNANVTYKGTDAYPYLYNFTPVNLNYGPSRGNFIFSGKNPITNEQHIIKYLRIDTANDPRFTIDETQIRAELQNELNAELNDALSFKKAAYDARKKYAEERNQQFTEVFDESAVMASLVATFNDTIKSSLNIVKNNIDLYKNNTAFFTSFYNTQSNNIIFECPVVIGSGDYTGVFFASSNGGNNVENYTVINPIVESSGTYVGGIFGELDAGTCQGHKVYVKEETDYFDNHARNYKDRRIIGNITWDDPTKDPYETFYIKGTSTGTYAGGIAGHTKTQLTGSVASIRVVSDGYAGGLIGLANGGISKCHVGGHTYNGSFRLPGGAGYLINIDGKEGAGGLAAVASGGSDGCYTTCSVRQYAGKTTYDTFIGSKQSGSNGSYAIGELIDVENREIAEKGSTCSYVETDFKKLLKEGAVANSYDPIFKDVKYPYDKNSDASTFRPHYGDWPIEQNDIQGYGMFYWEKEGNAYRIKAVGEFNVDGKNEVSTLCIDRDAQSISSHGYGYFYSSDYVDSSTGGTNFTGDDLTGIRNALNSAGLRGVTFKELSSTDHGDKTFNFTANNDAVKKAFYYNPDFCALSTESFGSGYEYEIRSFEQLENLSKNSSYWSKKFKLSHDIPFNGNSITPIGVSATPFTGNFDGHLYRLVGAKLDTSGTEAGIFGYVNNATINGVVVFNADYTLSGLGDNAHVGGVVGRATGNTTISNCAFTGHITATSSGSIYAGGIVGFADGDEINLRNCQAVMSDFIDDTPDMTINGNSGIVVAGGIAGMYDSLKTLENCYSGGYITASGGTNTYVGGIVGINKDSDAQILKCYTYYQTDVGVTANTFPHPIGKAGSYTNCFYLRGNWYNIAQEIPAGITWHDEMQDFIDATNSLDSQGFSKRNKAYSDNLVNEFEYKLPATISEGGDFYHYGQSPDETMVAMGDKRFGAFYWEEEGGKYNLKVLYYNKPDKDSAYVLKTPAPTLCKDKDGNAITKSGYGYFVGKGIKNGSMGNLGSLESSKLNEGSATYTGIKGSIETVLGVDSGKLSDNFTFAFYDFSNSDYVTKTDVILSSADADSNGKKFTIIPGLCAIHYDEHPTREVRTVQHLKNVSASLGSTFKQTHDIIFNSSDAPLVPIGGPANPYTGTYDGNCYRIYNLKVTGNTGNVGLFGTINGGARIENTFIINGTINGIGDNFGGIVGKAENATIKNSIFTGNINGTATNIGGIVGSLTGGSLTSCEATANITVTGSGATVGGIVGTVANTTVSSCYSGGSVPKEIPVNSITVGGIVGYGISTANVENCYTHMSIPQFEHIENPTVHPIVNGEKNDDDTIRVTITNCHYIESKNHYAHDFEIENEAKVKKHYAYDTISILEFNQPATANTYRRDLTPATNEADRYPMPAIVKDSSTFVHYGDWKPIVPLYAPGYGVFYWEKEGDDFHVRVCGIKENTDGAYEFITDPENRNVFNYIESKDFCYDMDGEPISEYGYGYFYPETKPLDDFTFGYYTTFGKDNVKASGIVKALKDLGINDVQIQWNSGIGNLHVDTTVQLKLEQGNTPLTVNGQNVYIKYNLDFCYLKMWTGELGDEPADGTYKYEIRNDAQLSTVGLNKFSYSDDITGYLAQKYIQTHDIHPSISQERNFSPIGTKGAAFTGIYNGNGYRLINALYKGYKINEDGEREPIADLYYIGLFGYTDTATIENVTVFNANIDVESLSHDDSNGKLGAIGGIVGYAKNTKINNCVFTGNISAGPVKLTYRDDTFALGGIVGYGINDTNSNNGISNCQSVANISWNDKEDALTMNYGVYQGGIAGTYYNGSISSCYAGGNLGGSAGGAGHLGKAKLYLGGIVSTGKVTVDSCYSYIDVVVENEKVEEVNPIGNDTWGKNWKLEDVITEDVAISNCCYLGNSDGYVYEFNENEENRRQVTTLFELATVSNTILPDDNILGPRLYANAYGDSLTNHGYYPLAAVVRVDNKVMHRYVHYGYIDGFVQYKINKDVKPANGGDVEIYPYAIPGDEVPLTVVTTKPNYVLESITIKRSDGGSDIPLTIDPDETDYSFKMPKCDVDVEVVFKSTLHKIELGTPLENGHTVGIQSQAKGGTRVEFSVNAFTGWQCKDFTVKQADGTSVEVHLNEEKTAGYFTMPDADVTIYVEFEEIPSGKYKITVHQPDNGTVESSHTASDSGKPITLTVTPNEGYRLSTLNVTGEVSVTVNGGTYTFTMPESDVDVSATFIKESDIPANSYHITVILQGNGKISDYKVNGASTSYANGLFAEYNVRPEICVSPNKGWKYTGGTATADGYDANTWNSNIAFQMPANHVTVFMKFIPLKKVELSPCVGGTVKFGLNTNNIIDFNNPFADLNQNVSFEAIPDVGYDYDGLIVKKKASGEIIKSFDKWNQSGMFQMPDDNVILVPKFVKK